MRLAGRQLTQVTHQHPLTPDATVCLQIGSTMLYLHEHATVRRLRDVWTQQRPRMMALPYSAGQRLLVVSGTMSEPGVIAHARNEPPASSLLVPAKGDKTSPYIRIQFDRFAFEARDQEAYATTLHAVSQAFELAHGTFLESVELPAPRLGPRLADQATETATLS